MDGDSVQFSSPVSVTSTICDEEEEYPNNQSRTKAEQKEIFRSLWLIMRKYQRYVKKPAHDPPGQGNCGYYALARAVGIFYCDAHQRV